MDGEYRATPEQLVERMVHLLDIEEIDTDLYRGDRAIHPNMQGRVFGGQVIAQALVSATRSVEEGRVAHSLHAYFMRAGDPAHPILYQVTRDYDGRSFATRRVVALQRGKPILNLAASFHVPEDGIAHQTAMPEVPPPEELLPEVDYWTKHGDGLRPGMKEIMTRRWPVEFRMVHPAKPGPTLPRLHGWFRAAAPLADDPALHRAVLAFASDMILLHTSTLPHGGIWMTQPIQTASLDHALWLHEDFRADKWLLYATDSPWAGHARGFNRGQIFARDGRLVASVAQEGLMRTHK
ncbi:acyl-CoA thioesterase II [Oleomonas cavernae]|uniref:Acyl-CoA thioesterase 2 n=1 Tax=Oleomonas cavernae TaxID=2320859 RepID=A0A418WH18_9PROT|nr:acyl-CoA thioesterase II [Oleomonas cavernae]RJF89278.1 acyl-CoA thioesterase II [Oleomonas cavernae]